MKTVYRAFFVEGGSSLISLVSNRVEKHELSLEENGELRPSRIWTAKIRNCVNVVEAPGAKSLIATDTSGKHFGLCCSSGEIIWQSSALGEGDSGLVVDYLDKPDRSEEVFVFATWSGVLHRIDPKTGTATTDAVTYETQLRDLQKDFSSQRLFVTSIIPAKSDDDPVGELLNTLDLRTSELKCVLPNTFTNGIKVSPDGKRALCFFLEEDPNEPGMGVAERWLVKDIETGLAICERLFNEFNRWKVVWSADGKYIATADETGHHFYAAETLDALADVAGKDAQPPAFHPSGTHVCLCRAANTKIVPIEWLQQKHQPSVG